VKPVVVFLGPTLPHDEARAVLDAEYLPPAGHGDVLRAALRRPRAIALVDGVFDTVPAVWHKEILFALSEGVHVYGAASMGALRAAELDRFGMRGVGAVYRAYADGALEDDDEVAVAQADAEHGFQALSDSMVDVRATLDAAVASGLVEAPVAAEIAARVKETFYPRRMLLAALDQDDEAHERLRAWLPRGWVLRKRADALELLRVVGADLLKGLEPFRPGWTLQRTRFWEEARRSVEHAAAGRPEPVPVRIADEELEAVLDEYRLDPDRYRGLLDRSLLVELALAAAAAEGVDGSGWAYQVALDRERLRRGQLEPEDTTDWLEQRGLSHEDITAVAQRLAALRWTHQAHHDAVSGELPLALRTDDAFSELAERAARKRAVLASLPADGDPTDDELLSWYFITRLQQKVPPALETWASAHGWSRPSDLVRTLRAEWRFESSLAATREDRKVSGIDADRESVDRLA
jgi:hypothetical protein